MAVGIGGSLAVHISGGPQDPTPARYADAVVDFGRFAVDTGVASSQLFSRAPHGILSRQYPGCEDGVITPGEGSPELNGLGEEDSNGGPGWFNLAQGSSDNGTLTCADAAFDEGFIIVRFDNNVALPDGDNTTDDIRVWETGSAFPGDRAQVFVSEDGVTYINIGVATGGPNEGVGTAVNGFPLVTHGTEFDLDQAGLDFVRFVKLVNESTRDLGFQFDAVEALNYVIEHVTDGCNEGDDGRDIEELWVSSNGTKITVTLELCGAIFSDNTKYRLHLDYDDTNGLATNVTRDGSTCDVIAIGGVSLGDQAAIDAFNAEFGGTTSDDGMKRRGDKDTGPGMIDGSGDTLTYMVDYSELGLGAGDLVRVWADVQHKGIVDRAPNTDDGDGCAKPTGADEVIGTVLD